MTDDLPADVRVRLLRVDETARLEAEIARLTTAAHEDAAEIKLLRGLLQTARAEALEDAADNYEGYLHTLEEDHVRNWLRARAAAERKGKK